MSRARLPLLYAVQRGALVEGFPPVCEALQEPNGLLAAGTELSAQILQSAYRQGIFPWYNEGEPVLWWSPDPRCVLFPERLRVPRGLRRDLRRLAGCRLTRNQAFPEILRACAAAAPGREQTWLHPAMRSAYLELHRLGMAWSVEIRDERDELIGGIYGVQAGTVYSGESMFSRRPGASRATLIHLARNAARYGLQVIDCQLPSPHLERMGAELIPRTAYQRLLP